MNRRPLSSAVGCMLLVLLAFVTRGPANSEEQAGAAAPLKGTPRALMDEYASASPPKRRLIERSLRAHGSAALPALRAALKKGAPRAPWKRLVSTIRVDFHRAHVPEGMVYIPAGHLETPRKDRPWGPSGQREWVQAFYLDRHEVSVEAWRRWRARLVTEEESSGALRRLWAPPRDMPGDWPASQMRWEEARRFAGEFRGGRLPRAEEFERALRGSGLSTYPWGGELRAGRTNLKDLGPGRPLPVGSFPSGASAFGILDLVGNVAEWSATKRRKGTRGMSPLVLGGSFVDAPSEALTWRGLDRMRTRLDASERKSWLGFRVARDVPSLP